MLSRKVALGTNGVQPPTARPGPSFASWVSPPSGSVFAVKCTRVPATWLDPTPVGLDRSSQAGGGNSRCGLAHRQRGLAIGLPSPPLRARRRVDRHESPGDPRFCLPAARARYPPLPDRPPNEAYTLDRISLTLVTLPNRREHGEALQHQGVCSHRADLRKVLWSGRLPDNRRHAIGIIEWGWRGFRASALARCTRTGLSASPLEVLIRATHRSYFWLKPFWLKTGIGPSARPFAAFGVRAACDVHGDRTRGPGRRERATAAARSAGQSGRRAWAPPARRALRSRLRFNTCHLWGPAAARSSDQARSRTRT